MKSRFFHHCVLSLLTSVAMFATVIIVFPTDGPLFALFYSAVTFLMCFIFGPVMGNPPTKENEDKDMEDATAGVRDDPATIEDVPFV